MYLPRVTSNFLLNLACTACHRGFYSPSRCSTPHTTASRTDAAPKASPQLQAHTSLHIITKTVQIQTSMVNGSSMYPRKACSHWAPSAPSTTRWSALRVAFRMEAASKLPSAPTTTLLLVVPTARIAACSTAQRIGHRVDRQTPQERLSGLITSALGYPLHALRM